MQIPSMEAFIHEIYSSPEVTLPKNVTSSPATSHITMAIPSQTTTKTSSLISTCLSIPPIDEVRDEFNEYLWYLWVDIDIVKLIICGKTGQEEGKILE